MKKSVENRRSVKAEKDKLKSFMDANRVYEELGNNKGCQALIDKSPTLIYEDELTLRLHNRNGELRKCKVYIFDDYFLVASKNTRKMKPIASKGSTDTGSVLTSTSSDSGIVWLGSNKAPEESVYSKDTPKDGEKDYDSDASYGDIVKDIVHLEKKKGVKEKKTYKLKMWVDLGKIKPRFLKSDEWYGVSIIYVSKISEEIAPGEYRYITVVDQAEIWMEDETKAKTICGLIQDAVHKKALETIEFIQQKQKAEHRLRNMTMKTEDSATDTDTENVTLERLGRSGSKLSTRRKSRSSLTEKRRLAKEKFKKGKDNLAVTVAMNALPSKARREALKSLKNDQDKYALFSKDIQSDQNGIASYDEGLEAEFAVNFKNSKLGFKVTSKKHIGPFVAGIVSKSLAEASGVCLGDKVVAVNDVEIKNTYSWQQCVDIIAQQKGNKNLLITFRRKQKSELQRLQKDESQRKANEEVGVSKREEQPKEEKHVDENGDDLPVIGHTKTIRNVQSMEVRRNTEGNFTIRKKKSKQRGFARSMQIYNETKNLTFGQKGMKDFSKNKKRIIKLYDQVDDLFNTVQEYSKSKPEQLCLYALKEIYDTECKYLTSLNHLRGIHMALLTAQKNVRCKNLKTSKPFCEHRRPRRLCTQESSFREEAIDHKIVNSIFLNLKPIIQYNHFLFTELQEKIGELYEAAAQNIKVEVYEILEVFCDVFVKVAPFLTLYWKYCERYTKACEMQRLLRADNHFFAEIVKPLEKKYNVKLPNLMMQPVQRISRYQLLFETLQKHVSKYATNEKDSGVPEEHLKKLESAKENLKTAFEKLFQIAKKVNVQIGQASILDKMVEVFEEIGGEDKIPNLMAPHRRFDSKQEVGYEHPSLDIAEKNALLYLFNDKVALVVVRELPVFQKPSYSIGRFFGKSRTKSIQQKEKRGTVISETEAKKKLSLPKKDTKNNRKSRKKSTRRTFLRLSNDRNTSNRFSIGSKGSKGSEQFYYDVLFHFPMRDIGVISERRKTTDDVVLYGVDIFYSKKRKDGSDTTSLTIWVEDQGKREALKNRINDLRQEDSIKRNELRRIKAKLLGKKQRKFVKKMDGYKKGSIVPGGRTKSSLYSKV